MKTNTRKCLFQERFIAPEVNVHWKYLLWKSLCWALLSMNDDEDSHHPQGAYSSVRERHGTNAHSLMWSKQEPHHWSRPGYRVSRTEPGLPGAVQPVIAVPRGYSFYNVLFFLHLLSVQCGPKYGGEYLVYLFKSCCVESSVCLARKV